MDAPENLAAQIAEKPTTELVDMFRLPHHWLPKALDIARAELQRRGVDPVPVASVAPEMPTQACPSCKSQHLVVGEIGPDATSDYSVVFKPERQRLWSLALSKGVELSRETYACRDCGLIWSQVDRAALAEFINRHCG